MTDSIGESPDQYLSLVRIQMRQQILRIAVGLALLSGGADLSAQVITPEFALSPAFDSPRSQAPVQLNAHLSWSSMDLLEGRLELEFYANQRLVHTWVSREVVLAKSEVTLPVMAPPAVLPSAADYLSVRARFIAAQTTYDLDIHDVPYPPDFKRALTIGIVHPETAGMPPSDFTTPFQDRFAWMEPFRLDSALPNADWARHLTCRTIMVEPDLFTDEPLELVAFDLLIVTGAGFSDLDDDQLDALARWAEAGGALCVAGASSRTAAHRSFLNRITGSSPVEPILEFDDDGHVRFLPGNESHWLLAAPGVGRALVTCQPVDVDTPAWRRDLLELWRVRPEQIENILATGNWEYPLEHEFMLREPQFQPLRPDPTSHVPWLQSHLMPNRVEGVPLPTVAILLAACLLAVGPGDYFLLGWLNRRRWTWALFPAVAIGFAIFMVRLANSHMGQSDYRTTLSVVDLTRDGRPARTSRFELLFTASEKQIEEELSQTLAVPLVSWQESFVSGYGEVRTPSIPDGAPPVTIGRVPRSYTQVRGLRKWTPRLARYTTLAAGDETVAPEFDWWQIEPGALRNADQRQIILDDLQTTLPEAQIVLRRGDESWRPTSGAAAPRRVDDVASEPPSARPGSVSGDEEAAAGERTLPELPEQFAMAISERPAEGMFHIVSQISPNAAGNFEDLTIFDSGDPRQWLLLIITADDQGDYQVYRRLIRENR